VRRSQIWEGRQEPGDPHDVATPGGASFKPRSCNASRTIWLVKPHSLSYQHITFARSPGRVARGKVLDACHVAAVLVGRNQELASHPFDAVNHAHPPPNILRHQGCSEPS
jgi:hypothetical protein